MWRPEGRPNPITPLTPPNHTLMMGIKMPPVCTRPSARCSRACRNKESSCWEGLSVRCTPVLPCAGPSERPRQGALLHQLVQTEEKRGPRPTRRCPTKHSNLPPSPSPRRRFQIGVLLKKKACGLKREKKLALSFFHAVLFFFFFFIFPCRSIFFQVLLTAVGRLPQFVSTNKMSEVPFSVASHVGHR